MDASFNAESRAADLATMGRTPLDLLVIGGGITGAGVARDAAMRGLTVALVDKGDFAAGTSSVSSRLIHGGLRYLELYDFRLVFEASRERRILLRIAPHLVWPRSFLFPVFRGARVPAWKLRAGLWLYDALSLFRNVSRHQWLGKRALLRAEPQLRSGDLKGGARYWDAQCDDARLTLANARDARRHGAFVANYARVDQLEKAEGRVRGARITDLLSGTSYALHAHVVVNATGPWSDLTRTDGADYLRPTKGVHVMVPGHRLGNTEAITLTSPVDGRVMFVLPWGEYSYIGTTDTDWPEQPDLITVTKEDVVYLLRSANAVFPNARLSEEDILSKWTGLRPLLRDNTDDPPGKISREHRIIVDNGQVSVMGGKLTTYRSMAADVVDHAAQELARIVGRQPPKRARTDRVPLPGGETAEWEPFRREALAEGIPPMTVERWLRLYGTEIPALVKTARGQADLMAPIVAGHPALMAEVVHACRREMAMRLRDILVRRTHVHYEVRDNARAEAARVADVAGDILGWDAARRDAELTYYRER
ncbi:MAG: glycerol-3-phosphate dehydrogenase [Gemmatimonadales bacterium]